MEIKAKCKFDKESATALARISTYRKKSPVKTFAVSIVLCLLLAALIACEIIIFGFDKNMGILIAADALLIFFELFRYFCIPMSCIRAIKNLEGAVNEYTFSENELKIVSVSENINGESSIKYSFFIKVFETSRYFFLFEAES